MESVAMVAFSLGMLSLGRSSQLAEDLGYTRGRIAYLAASLALALGSSLALAFLR